MDSETIMCESCIDNKESIFFKLPDKDKEILQKGHLQTIVKKGEIIYSEGDVPSGLLCLSQGKVKIFKSGIGGREQIVRLASPFGFIGYRALFADESYIASALALEDSIVCEIHKENLLHILRQNTSLSMMIIKHFADELGLSNSRTVTLTQKHIRGRLAEALLFLKKIYGFEEDYSTIQAYLSREDLANLSNMTTSNAIRTLSIFASENVISIDGRRIRILDMNKLERISSLG